MVTQPLTTISGISAVNYNGGQKPMLGTHNKLTFKINRTVSTSATYYIVPRLGWDESILYDKMDNGATITLSGTETDVTLNDIPLTSGDGNVLYTKIRIYNNSTDKRLLWESTGAVSNEMSSQIMPSNIEFSSEEPNHKYIFVDHPEHITKNETVEQGRLLTHLNDLTPGKYTVFVYHHKAVSSTLNFAHPFAAGDQIPDSTKLYFDAVFYNPYGDNTNNVKINNIGIGGSVDSVWNSYLGLSNSTAYDYNYNTFPQNPANKTWLSDLVSIKASDQSSKMLISGNSNMGAIWLMMEFEVTGGYVNFATMAYRLDSGTSNTMETHKSVFTESMSSSYYDVPEQTAKGMGDFSQTVVSDMMEYYIGTANNPGTPLNFNIENRVGSYISDLLYTNTSPMYYDAFDKTPDSAVMGIEYGGPTNPNLGRPMIFDGYHSPYIGVFNLSAAAQVNGITQFSQNEELPTSWLQALAQAGKLFSIDEINKHATIGGYGITYRFRFRIHNTSDDVRYLRYSISTGGTYYFEWYRNNGTHSARYINAGDGQEVFNNIELTPKTYTDITIDVSEMTGGSITVKHKFSVD